MRVTLDTNIIIDVMLKREPYCSSSLKVLKLAEDGKINAYMTPNSITDIIYILRKHYSMKTGLYEALYGLLEIIDVCDILKTDVLRAFDLDFDDYEDALIASCAKRMKSDYIITRDIKGFQKSSVKSISPDDFIMHHFY